jgi:hypothetical protein
LTFLAFVLALHLDGVVVAGTFQDFRHAEKFKNSCPTANVKSGITCSFT